MDSDYRTGPCYTIVKNDMCLGQLEGIVCTKNLCCATVGKAWGHPCEQCPTTLECEQGYLKNIHSQECLGNRKCKRNSGWCITHPEVLTSKPDFQTLMSARPYLDCVLEGDVLTQLVPSLASVPRDRRDGWQPIAVRTGTSVSFQTFVWMAVVSTRMAATTVSAIPVSFLVKTERLA